MTIILHHNVGSPYSEKIRLMFGYLGTHWQSVEVTPYPKRPSIDDAVEGYRRIPVMQIGADYFCDSNLIADELAQLYSKPTLSLYSGSSASVALAVHAETDGFRSCIASIPKWLWFYRMLRVRGTDTIGFFKDRLNLAKTEKQGLLPQAEAQAIWADFIHGLEENLTTPFFGGTEPDIADFAAYHFPWYYEAMTGRKVAPSGARIDKWQKKMDALGQGVRQEITAEFALETARNSPPLELPESQSDPLLDQQVQIAPVDYAKTDTTGHLVCSNATKWVLARQHRTLGDIHVHFPKTGYEIKAAS